MDLINLASEIGLEPKRSASTNGSEYSSACPDCGGNDRFRIWPNQQTKNCVGKFWCRQCDKKGDAIQFCIDFLGLTFQQAKEKLGVSIERRDCGRVVERSFVAPALIPPSDGWTQRAEDFVLWAHEQIWGFPDKVAWLTKRGIPELAIKNYKIGYCGRDIWVNPIEFGLDAGKKLFFPEGIVIPSIEPSEKIVRLKIRRTKWKEGDELPKYWAVRGSMNGLNMVGDFSKPMMLVVESELDAYAAHCAGSDSIFAVAVGSNTKNPDNVTDFWAKRRKILICHDNDEGGLAMNEKWQRLYPHAISSPVPLKSGKDIGEAIENGLNLGEWITSILY